MAFRRCSRISEVPGAARRGTRRRSIRNRYSGALERGSGKRSTYLPQANHHLQWPVGRLGLAPESMAAGIRNRSGLETLAVRGLALAVSLLPRVLSTWD